MDETFHLTPLDVRRYDFGSKLINGYNPERVEQFRDQVADELERLTRQAQDIWGPLALVDYGDAPTAYAADNTGQRLPIGANLAFSRAALVAAGGWRTDLGKVNNTLISGEDHEIFLRLRRRGLYAGYYDPELTEIGRAHV